MSRFNAKRGLIIVQSELFGPSGSIIVRLALDTGATATMVNVGLMTAIGYDPSLAPDRIEVTTGSSVCRGRTNQSFGTGTYLLSCISSYLDTECWH